MTRAGAADGQQIAEHGR
jgi:hypothetical protein